jgi:hypothetical protein
MTIGFIPRDRFCMGAKALSQLFERTPLPFQLITVDPAMPAKYRKELEAVLEGRDNVRVLDAPPFASTNAMKNIAARASDTDYVCLIENDVFVLEGWLERMVQACEEMPADVAVPLIYERTVDSGQVHFDDRLGAVRRVATPRGPGIHILPREEPLDADLVAARRPIDTIETHCALFRRSALERMGDMDPDISTSRNEVDLSLALYQIGARVVFEPSSRVVFCPPPPIEPEERKFYIMRWEPQQGERDQERITNRWNIVDFPTSIGFCQYRKKLAEEPDPDLQMADFLSYQSKMQTVTEEIASVVPAGSKMILVDEVQWNAGEVAKNRKTLPFLERDGQFYGPPADAAAGIAELERMRAEGAEYIVFGWPAFWWFDSYPELLVHLRRSYRLVLENERLLAFQLNAGRSNTEEPCASAISN